MTDEQRKQLEQSKRVAQNIHVLLREGMFPGKNAEAVYEGQKFLEVMVAQLESELKGPAVILPTIADVAKVAETAK